MGNSLYWKRITYVMWFSTMLCGATSADPAFNLSASISRAFPDFAVTVDETMSAGSIVDANRSIPFEVTGPKDVLIEDISYAIYAVTFSTSRGEAIETFLESGELAESLADGLLVIAPVSKPENTISRIIDHNAQSVRVRAIEIEDFIGDGTLQINLETTNTYLVTEPNEIIQDRRYYLYTLPALEEIFAATTMRVVANEFTKEMTEARKIRFSGEYAKGNRHIEMYEAIGNTSRKVPLVDGRFEYQSVAPSERDENATAKRRVLRKTFKLQVVDPTGIPIPGALIFGKVSWVRSIDWKERHEDIRAFTDANGYFETTTPDNVSITIMHDGYYTLSKTWSSEHITDERIVVILQPEHEPVNMYSGSLDVRKDTDADRYEFGIDFLPKKVARNNEAISDNVNESDIWVTLYRTEPSLLEGDASIRAHNNRVWRMKIAGRNGWGFLPETSETSKMREAPDGDYVTELDHSFSEMPQGIYLKNDGNGRFGKLMLTVFDHSDFGKVYRYCSMSYNVQAEAVGTRSLNPE